MRLSAAEVSLGIFAFFTVFTSRIAAAGYDTQDKLSGSTQHKTPTVTLSESIVQTSTMKGKPRHRSVPAEHHHRRVDETSSALSPLESKYINVTTDINIDPSGNGANSGASPAHCKDSNDPSCDLGRGNGGVNSATTNATCLDRKYKGNYKDGFCQFWSQNGSTTQYGAPQLSGVDKGAQAALGAVFGFFGILGFVAVMTRLCLVGGGY